MILRISQYKGGMPVKVTWLGQAGLLFAHNGKKIVIDPYLSDSVKKVNPANYRRFPVEESFFDLKPDMLIFTHNHLDHYDPETVERFITPDSAMTVLAPGTVWPEVRKLGGKNNYVLFDRHTLWSEFGLEFTAVKAQHSDSCAIGVIIDDGKRKYYVTGDTLYHQEIFLDLPHDIYALFLPINGVGNNMNMTDAVKFAQRVNPQKVIPIHWGMFDELDPDAFAAENKIIPTIYKEIEGL